MANGIKERHSKKTVKTQPGDLVKVDSKSTVNNGTSTHKPGFKDGTIRFMLDPQRAKDEKHTVSEFFNLEEEEYESEILVERPIERERRRP